MDNTKIEWTDATWNPIRGCTPVSDGCRNCYAARVAHRFSGPGEPYEGLADWRGGRAVFNGTIRIVESAIDQPLRWKRPRRIFVNSMSDLFHENVPTDYIDMVFAAMAQAPHHTFQILTKRPARMANWFASGNPHLRMTRCFRNFVDYADPVGPWPLPNVWLGVSVEDQKAADDRIPLLLQTPAAVRFLSCEPLMGAVDLQFIRPLNRRAPCTTDALTGITQWPGNDTDEGPRIDWVIAGGESGPGARQMHPDWARSLRDQCASSGVPFLFKQWGEHDIDGDKVGKKAAGRLLDGRTHDEFPNGAA